MHSEHWDGYLLVEFFIILFFISTIEFFWPNCLYYYYTYCFVHFLCFLFMMMRMSPFWMWADGVVCVGTPTPGSHVTMQLVESHTCSSHRSYDYTGLDAIAIEETPGTSPPFPTLMSFLPRNPSQATTLPLVTSGPMLPLLIASLDGVPLTSCATKSHWPTHFSCHLLNQPHYLSMVPLHQTPRPPMLPVYSASPSFVTIGILMRRLTCQPPMPSSVLSSANTKAIRLVALLGPSCLAFIAGIWSTMHLGIAMTTGSNLHAPPLTKKVLLWESGIGVGRFWFSPRVSI